MNKVTTLNQFIIEQQAGVPQATGGFSCLLHHVGIAAKKVNRDNCFRNCRNRSGEVQ